jgi:hypothetical protein
MNFLRQVEVLEKAGETGSFAEIRLHMTFPILSLGSMLLLCLHAFSAEHHLPQLKDWNSATAVARAFSIGARESEAVSNLKEKIDKKIVAELKDACSSRGMRQFLTHEAISKGLFNIGWSSGSSGLAAWNVELTNDGDNHLAA